MDYPKAQLLKCEPIEKWFGYYLITLRYWDKHWPDGVTVDYEESGTQISVNLSMDEWDVKCELPEVFGYKTTEGN